MKQHIVSKLADAVHRLQKAGSLPAEGLPEIMVERTRERAHGDFASNFALTAGQAGAPQAARTGRAAGGRHRPGSADRAHRNRRPGFHQLLSSAPMPGTPSSARSLEQGAALRTQQPRRGPARPGRIRLRQPTGPLHVGHGRGAAYGAAVANLLEAVGFAVHREYYVNDAGRQMDILAASVYLRYLELCGEDIPFPANGYQGDYVWDIARHAAPRARRRACAIRLAEVSRACPTDEPAGGDKEAHIDA